MSRFDPALLERALQWVRPPPVDVPAIQRRVEQQRTEATSAMAIAAALCRRFEGLHLEPYLDPVGIPTIGFGTTMYPNGIRVTLRDPRITAVTAEVLLMHHLRYECLHPVRRLCPVALTEGQLGALMSFVFNLGAPRLATATLRRRVLVGDWDAARVEIRRWVFAGGRRWRGLVLRREAEAQFF